MSPPSSRRRWLAALLGELVAPAGVAWAVAAGRSGLAAVPPAGGTAPVGDARPASSATGAAAGPAPDPATAAEDAGDDAVSPQRRLRFARDHGAHPGARIEWWYATGWLQPEAAGEAPSPGAAAAAASAAALAADHARPTHGFQLTFFRSRVGDGQGGAGRFAPRQLLFAHAALTDLAARRHVHAQRIARWSGDEALPDVHARRADADVRLAAWRLQREPRVGAASHWLAELPAPDGGFALRVQLDEVQPPLLQGELGFSRKGPAPEHASHYYSLPQLAVAAQVEVGGRRLALAGRGWLDHEWSEQLLAPQAVGWDWMGINLFGGGALTAFVLRRADGSALWAGGSHRGADGALRNFGPAEVGMQALRHWNSPDSGARWPVAWRIRSPAGDFLLDALFDAQELDSRASTGTVYWEGLAELRLIGGQRAGLGYLEMTGRAGRLQLG